MGLSCGELIGLRAMDGFITDARIINMVMDCALLFHNRSYIFM